MSNWNNGTVIGAADTFYSLTDPRLAQLTRNFGYMQGFGSATATWLSMNTPADFLAAWNRCPPLAAIICNIAQADINGRTAFFRAGTDKEIKPDGYNKTVKDLAALFNRPNPLQTWRQFRAQQKCYVRIFGICPVLKVKAVGFDTPKMMWNIPPQLVKIETTGKLFYQSEQGNIIKRITVTLNGVEKELPVEDVFFLRDQTVSLNSEFLPDSRLKVLTTPISNIVAAYEASNVLITKRGALGIFSNTGKDTVGTMPVDASEKEALQQDLNGYGLSGDLKQFIVTSASLSWQQIALNAKDLMLIETVKNATESVCDVMGYKFELLANEKGTTFENQKTALASLYQDTIIPEAAADAEVYNDALGISAAGFEVNFLYDHVEVLQQSEKEKAEGREATNKAALIEWNAGKLTLNEWQEMVGGKAITGDQFNLYKPEYDNWQREQGYLPPMVDPNKQTNNEPTA